MNKLYIKDEEIPKHCLYCKFGKKDFINIYCPIKDWWYECIQERPNDCPLRPLSEAADILQRHQAQVQHGSACTAGGRLKGAKNERSIEIKQKL
jgi:hypothetical protein